jgi:imidazole glycerol-phosphate synthase subunit HisH
VLPGVGSFGQCAASLHSMPGMIEALNQRVIKEGAPFLGICIGMQLLARRGSEYGAQNGLGWMPGEVVKLNPRNPMFKVPHMGWNPVTLKLAGFQNPALKSVEDGGKAYFVHSHQFQPTDHRHLLGTCDYGGPVTAIVGRDNILGVQFHPERSQTYGLAFLRAFLDWRP